MQIYLTAVVPTEVLLGFHCGSASKESACVRNERKSVHAFGFSCMFNNFELTVGILDNTLQQLWSLFCFSESSLA